ncbi:four helix bundle protein [Dethiothermospora halolimnae]|uniref:four helix bundle protein n=1 Tax=Dethiothermospora halolimnae TaxID=3114390 RepID=UPI003CCBAB57
MKENISIDKSFKFSLRIIKLYKYLCKTKKEFVLSKQLLRSGTSIGANLNEGIYAQSKKDFLSKMYLAFKEANETEYWLQLLVSTEYLNKEKTTPILNDCIELKKLLHATIKTTKKNLSIKE